MSGVDVFELPEGTPRAPTKLGRRGCKVPTQSPSLNPKPSKKSPEILT